MDQKPLGRGGYATVWRGEHRENGTEAAVKRPHRQDNEALARFEREIEVQSALDHPNIMPLVEHSVTDQWLAMPLAKHSLTKVVDGKRGPIDGYQLVAIVRAIAEGIAYAHRRNFVHRDVNPNNILELEDRWVLADWGLVSAAPKQGDPRLTRRSTPVLGTEGFTAPEAEKDPLINNPSVDVFSIGMVAHYAVTGVWPRANHPMPKLGWLWNDFVVSCTSPVAGRPATMAAVIKRLSSMEQQVDQMQYEDDTLICPQCQAEVTGARCLHCGRMWD